jgi:hypothetical protein
MGETQGHQILKLEPEPLSVHQHHGQEPLQEGAINQAPKSMQGNRSQINNQGYFLLFQKTCNTKIFTLLRTMTKTLFFMARPLSYNKEAFTMDMTNLM